MKNWWNREPVPCDKYRLHSINEAIDTINPEKCATCEYYAADNEVCCNSNSEHCANFTLPNDTCQAWEAIWK